MKVAVVGATGMVGQTMIELLESRRFPVSSLLPVASKKSVGERVRFRGQDVQVISMEDAIQAKPDLALFSAGGAVSTEWAPKFAEVGCRVIDNSSAWRMDPDKKLCVPEVNGEYLETGDMIVANPNCSTIQLVMVLKPLHEKYGIKRAIVSTYQSVTGTGKNAVDQMENERRGRKAEMVYPYLIDQNVIPHCDVFEENGYTKEEMKLTRETVKILSDDSVKVTATAVRVPVRGGHSESVNLELQREFEISDIRKLLSETTGVQVQDNTDVLQYPMPRYAEGRDEVFVGRIRRDESHSQALNMWIVADNLRKGAATNAIQIAELMLKNGILSTETAGANA